MSEVVLARVRFKRCPTDRHEDCLGAYQYNGSVTIVFLCECEHCNFHDIKKEAYIGEPEPELEKCYGSKLGRSA